MKKNFVETFVGVVVVATAIYFAFFAYSGATLDEHKAGEYDLRVNFDRVDGINVGGDVRVSGLKVGNIKSAEIDPKTYQAKVGISISDDIKLPEDSSAEIISAGLLGDKYIAIIPGGSDEFLKEGDRIKFAQSSVSLESLIGKFMFSDDDSKDSSESTSSTNNNEPSTEEDFGF